MKTLEFQQHQDTVKIVDVPAPNPSPNQVKVKVAYSALDTGVDAVLHQPEVGKYIHSLATPDALYLGWHFSGVVESLGTDVATEDDEPSLLQVGDHVMGFLPYEPEQVQGAFSEFIVVESDQLTTFSPADLEASKCAAATTEYLTALQALRDQGKLGSRDEKPEKVLIVGGGGGVGLAAVQIAKHIFRANVSVSCSERDKGRVLAAGADIVLPRETFPDPLKDEQGTLYDVIFDTPTVLEHKATRASLHKGGRHVLTLPVEALFRQPEGVDSEGKALVMVNCNGCREDLSILRNGMIDGTLHVPVDSIYHVKDMMSAMQRQREKKTGRVVVQVENGW